MKKKILLSAYACEPEVGSEHGIGWGWINFLSNNNFKVEVITRLSNKKKIDKYLRNKKIKNIKFHYFDLSYFFLKIFKGRNNANSYFYFILWQLLIFFRYKSYIKKNNFDYVQHITFGSIRFPSFLGLCHKNFIFGPAAGFESIPIKLIKNFKILDKIKEIVRLVSNKYILFSPLMNLTFFTSKRILVSSKINFNQIPFFYRHKTQITFATRLIKKISKKPINIKSNYNKEIRILFVGRLLSWKGIIIILKTFKKINKLKIKKKFKLYIRGDGPLKNDVKRFILDNNLIGKVLIIKKQKNLKQLYSNASLFFFPSLRETGGMALLEAMSLGIPPAIINNGGPREIVKSNCGIVVDHKNKNEKEIVNDFVNKILKLSNNKNQAQLYSKKSHKRVNNFIWNKKLLKIYQ